MTNDIPKGRRYSLLYLQPEHTIEDSKRLRVRLLRMFQGIVAEESKDFGQAIERELGVEVVRTGPYATYLDWDRFAKLEMRDYLDSITITRRFYSKKFGSANLPKVASEFNRVFLEERTTYFVDEQLGVHPLVDSSFRAILESAVRGLGGADFAAARAHLEKADIALMPQNDRRESVRAVFDALENVFKQTFTGVININTATIQGCLKPAVESMYSEGVERRTALKQVDSLRDWVDGCHNYRHEPGQPEPTSPSEDLAVLLVSNGISFTRWIADIRSRLNN